MADSEQFERQQALVQINLELLRQALTLVDSIDDRTYGEAPRALTTQRVAGHMRHIIEFYECFLDGLKLSRVDYDARKRDLTLEADRQIAGARIRMLMDRLVLDAGLGADGVIHVRMEDFPVAGVAEPYLKSSTGRELQALSSHTIHHFALIAMVLAAHGRPVAPDFGMSPSTLRYQEEKREREALVVA